MLGERARSDVEDFVRRNEDRLVRELRSADGRHGLAAARRLDRRLHGVVGDAPGDEVRRVAIAELLAGLEARTLAAPPPPSIAALYPKAIKILTDYLAAGLPYDPDLYGKDARFVAGIAVPAGAQIVDVPVCKRPWVHLRHIVRMTAMTGRLALMNDFSGCVKLFSAHGWRLWLEIHTDPRNLEDFNEAGWDDCYRRIADILRSRSDLAGVWGVSWFYDPQLTSISPRLAYLQERPLARGAILVRLRPGQIHTERAKQTSPTRKALIESGDYRPVCYAMFWPRRSLLAWASCQIRTDTGE